MTEYEKAVHRAQAHKALEDYMNSAYPLPVYEDADSFIRLADLARGIDKSTKETK